MQNGPFIMMLTINPLLLKVVYTKSKKSTLIQRVKKGRGT